MMSFRRWRMMTFVAVLVVLPCSAWAAETCSAMLAAAQKLYDDAQYEEALDAWRTALKEDVCQGAEKVQLHSGLAKAHVALGDMDAALREMKNALRLDPQLTLDPRQTSPKLLHVLHQAREELRASTPPPPPPVEIRPAARERPMSAQRTAAWATFGTGLALAAGGGTMLGLAFSENDRQVAAADDKDWDARDEHWAKTKTYASWSYALLGLAAADLATSIILFAVPEKRPGQAARAHELNIGITPVLSPKRQAVWISLQF
jgi:tetratricopeptide (TPR) repeat protein